MGQSSAYMEVSADRPGAQLRCLQGFYLSALTIQFIDVHLIHVNVEFRCFLG